MLIAQPAPVADASASPWLTSEPPAAALQQPSVSAVMPCLNEEKTLATCIVKAQRCFEALGIDGEVIVADNGSTDRSVEIALALGARVVHQPLRGYGAALQAGFAAARGDIVVMGDADDSYDWSAMGSLIDKVD